MVFDLMFNLYIAIQKSLNIIVLKSVGQMGPYLGAPKKDKESINGENSKVGPGMRDLK